MQKKGLAQGKNKSIEIAEKSLRNGLDMQTISMITGLSENGIKKQ
ncbi:hypothetical protein [Clostridium baratii]